MQADTAPRRIQSHDVEVSLEESQKLLSKSMVIDSKVPGRGIHQVKSMAGFGEKDAWEPRTSPVTKPRNAILAQSMPSIHEDPLYL